MATRSDRRLSVNPLVPPHREQAVSSLQLIHLPAFARHIRDNRMDEFLAAQYEMAKDLQLPLLKLFGHLEEKDLLELFRAGLNRLLDALIDNKPEVYFERAVDTWLHNQQPLIARNMVHSDDLVLTSLIRRSVFRGMLPAYSPDPVLSFAILDELDQFLTRFDRILFKTLLSIQNDFHEQAQEVAQIGHWQWDLSTDSLFWSKELFRIYELEPQDIVTYDIAAFNHPDDAEMISRQMKISRETKRPHDFYYRINLPSGKEKYLHAIGRVLVDEQGEAERMIGTLQDVSREKYMERSHREQIHRHEDRYAKMVEEVEDYAILLISNEGIIQNWNRGAEKIKGWAAGEIIGRHLRTFYVPEDQANHLPEKLIEHARRHGKVTHEGWRARKDGTRFWASIVLTALHDDAGEVIGFTKVTRDLTGKKTTEELLRSYNNQLKEKNSLLEATNKELESFTYIASHDLQEPVRKIMLWANRIGDVPSLPENVQTAVAKIEKAGARMQALIRGLLDYAHMDNSREEAQETALDSIVSDVLEEFAEPLESRGASVSRTALPVLWVYRFQMTQLFSNLLSNAIKYARPDVPLQIELTGTNNCTGPDGKVCHEIRFADNGTGFDPEYAEKIFEIFQRLDTVRSPGTGIGLAICRKIVQNHQGSIRAESVPGQGAAFIILLPAAGERPVDKAPGADDGMERAAGAGAPTRSS